MAIKRIHINQHVIRRNNKLDLSIPGALEQLEPPVSCKEGRSNRYGFEVVINEHTRIVYRPQNPLPCGARVWVETTEDVRVVEGIPSSEGTGNEVL